MKANGGFAQLEWMIEYELHLADRNRRFVSMAIVKSEAPVGLDQLLGNSIRESDVFFLLNDNLGAVLMSDTGNSEVLIAIDRYKRAGTANGKVKMHFGVGFYPQDHLPASAFVSAVYGRLKKAEGLEPGAVVLMD